MQNLENYPSSEILKTRFKNAICSFIENSVNMAIAQHLLKRGWDSNPLDVEYTVVSYFAKLVASPQSEIDERLESFEGVFIQHLAQLLEYIMMRVEKIEIKIGIDEPSAILIIKDIIDEMLYCQYGNWADFAAELLETRANDGSMTDNSDGKPNMYFSIRKAMLGKSRPYSGDGNVFGDNNFAARDWNYQIYGILFHQNSATRSTNNWMLN